MDPVDITAGRFQLRPWQAGDEAGLAALLDDPAVARWTPHPSPFTLAHATARIAEDADHWDRGTRAELAIRDAATAELLGTVGLYHLTNSDAEIGWGTAAHMRGRGVATETVGALCRWAFGALGLERLTAVVDVGNWASRRVAEKNGFHLEGTTRATGHPGTWRLSRLAGDEVGDTALLPGYPGRTDGVVSLRRWRPDDAQDVARACADPDTARWLPVSVPYTAADARAYVEQIVQAQWSDGSAANVAVTDAVTGELLGAVGLRLRDGIGEVGYWTAPWTRGRGVAGRAAQLHTAWGVEALGLARVELLTDTRNTASQRVAERAGFLREGVARAVRPEPRGTARVDMVVWSHVPGR